MPALYKGRPHPGVPHLRAVPDPKPVTDFGLLRWLHLSNGLNLIEREAKHHLKVAEEIGNETVAASLENVLDELRKAKEAVR